MSEYSVKAISGAPTPARAEKTSNVFTDGLPEGARVEDRGALGVFVVVPAIKRVDFKTGKELPGPDYSESRVDSPQDAALIAQGGQPWYVKHLKSAKVAK